MFNESVNYGNEGGTKFLPRYSEVKSQNQMPFIRIPGYLYRKRTYPSAAYSQNNIKPCTR